MIRVIACDIFGTTVDWYTGVSVRAAKIFDAIGVDLDPGQFAVEWRDQYAPSMQRVRDGERAWANLDVLHRESLDALLHAHDVDDAVDEAARQQLVRAWHELPAWADSVAGLARLRTRHLTATLSNGGFALLVHLVKSAGLPFDAIIGAELIGHYKPDPRVYRSAASLLDVAPEEVLMVAAHARDLDAARSVGLQTAFVERPHEQGPDRMAERAADVTCELSATSFLDLAAQLGC
jgi:2-haloacid dehalogenase